jgi:hypothetical protein
VGPDLTTGGAGREPGRAAAKPGRAVANRARRHPVGIRAQGWTQPGDGLTTSDAVCDGDGVLDGRMPVALGLGLGLGAPVGEGRLYTDGSDRFDDVPVGLGAAGPVVPVTVLGTGRTSR